MKKILFVLITGAALMLSGCGSNDFDVPGADGNDTNGTTVGGGTQPGGTTGANYRFANPSNIIVTSGRQKRNITVQLVDAYGVGVAGAEIRIKTLPARYGFITPSAIATDVAGMATFAYTAPADIAPLIGQRTQVTFLHFDGNTTTPLTASATILFDNAAVDVDQNTTLPIVVLPQDKRQITLTSNSESVEIAVKVFKDGAPYSGGSVKVALPPKVFSGTDVGQFNAYEVEPNAQGVATFNYTGPSNLQALLNQNDTGSTFRFYHIENSQAQQEMQVQYTQPANTNVTLNYYLSMATDGEYSMGIPNKQKQFTVTLKAQDGSGNDQAITSETITKITVKTANGTIAKLLDTNDQLVDEMELAVANHGGSFTLQSKTLSGLVPLEVSMEFTDANGKTHKVGGDFPPLTTIVNVRVFSGPPSAISISYVSTTRDADRAKYIETFAISVTDEYGNKVNTHPNISVGAIAGYTVDGMEAQNIETNETHRLFYGRDDIGAGNANGEIAAPDANHKTSFQDATAARNNVFRYVNAEGANTDKLVVFGERKNYEAMGKWDIQSLSANNVINLVDDYYGVQRSGLYYAVGHNYYQDQCRQDGREWIGSTDADSYQIDDEGTVTVRYAYDYHLAGKDVLIWANLDGIQPDTGKKTRIGEVLKHALRTTGLIPEPSGGYSLPKGGHGFGTFIIWHENAPERYRNAHFGYAIKAGSTCTYRLVADSNRFDARTCSNKVHVDTDGDGTPDTWFGTDDGTSYVTYELWAPVDKACIFAIDRVRVAPEF
jgi:hypothetical protein